MTESDYKFMKEAIYEAQKVTETQTSPNPRVGCIITHKGKIISRGFHKKAGTDHAEKMALKKLGNSSPKGAKLYVTLEPCPTQGNTGACCDAIISSGILEVFIGTIDPNPIHNGKGISILREAKIKVHTHLLAEECEALNPIFNKSMHL
jgi:diaminohydroxyphosphoribosylaminopyrimidine deaminase/5-amino-6-(5-phosphoribosylamino)uracil reductase